MGLTGAILGDIAGSLPEFKKEIEDWETCEIFCKNSVFTDDTVQSIAVKIAALESRDYGEVLQELCKKYLYVGYGDRFHKWLADPAGVKADSWGNGAAMRVSFLGEFCPSLEKTEEEAEKSAVCTHNTKEAIKGARCTAGSVFLAEHGASKEEILQYAAGFYPLGEYEYSVLRPLSDYRDGYRFEASCQKSVPVAIRCFYESRDYVSFLRNVYYMNGDTDTLGAIGGGIAHSFYKTTGLEERRLLEYYLDKTLLKWVYFEKV